jgi:creatinine amidohydrolase/Fe(II)-dependent formamide hydrolase-like protein
MSACGTNVIVVPVAAHEVRQRPATLEGLAPDVAVTANLDVQTLRQGVDDRHPDAVQATRHLVAAAVAELAAGVQDREDDFDRRALLLGHHRDGNPAAVIDDRDGVVGMDRDRHRRAVAGQRLVHRVVDDLVDEVVKAVHAG